MRLDSARTIAGMALLLLLLLITSGVSAQEERTNEAELALLEENVETFLQKVAEDEVHEALVELLRGSPLLKQTEAVANLEQKTRNMPSLYGALRDIEPVSTRRIGKSVVLVRFLANCE